MKFAVAALLATTSAITINKKGGCVSKRLANQGFDALDTDNSNWLSYDEIKVGVEELAKSLNHTLSADEWKWIEETGEKIDSKNPGHVNRREFREFANAVFEHFDLCDLAKKMEAQEQAKVRGPCVTRAQSNEEFHELDTNDNGSLDYDEIKAGLESLASALNYTPTAKDWAWIEKTGKRIDSKNPGVVNEKEFFRFANAVFRHYNICYLARDARKEEEEDQGAQNCDISQEESDQIFNQVDTNDNGFASPKELRAAITEYAKSQGWEISKKDEKWMVNAYKKEDPAEEGLTSAQFNQFANAVGNHFDLCGAHDE